MHVVDVAPLDGSEPWDAFATVRGELERYGAGLEERPFLVVLNKIDLLPAEDVEALTADWRERLRRRARSPQGEDAPVVSPSRRPPEPASTAVRGTIFSMRAGEPDRQVAPEEAAVAEHAVYRPGRATGSASSARPSTRSGIVGPVGRAAGRSVTTSRTPTRSRTSRSG